MSKDPTNRNQGGSMDLLHCKKLTSLPRKKDNIKFKKKEGRKVFLFYLVF